MNCCMLVSNGCCSSCKQYKNNSLVRQLKRLTDNKENDPSCTSSHINYRFLSTAQKDERLKKLHSELRSKTRRLQLLQKAIAQTYECDTISLDEDLSDDLSVLMKQYASKVNETHHKDTFQHLFWKQQLDAIMKKDRRSIRWHPLIIKWCLYLHHRSSGAYKSLRESGIIALPSGRTLRDYRHFAPAKSGFSNVYDQQLLDLAQSTKPAELAKHVVLLIDEMYVKEGVVYNKSSGQLTGFVELGDIDSLLNEFEQCSLQDSESPKKPVTLAKTIVVFMIRGLLTNLLFPYTVFPVNSLKGHNLFPLVWEVIGRLTLHGFRIFAITCDGASVNRKMFQMHTCGTRKEKVYKTVNIYCKEQHSIYFISDPPHLLKTLRNCFANFNRHLWVSISTCIANIAHT